MRSHSYLIHSIYKAIEGEGVNIGQRQVFIRYQGCSVGCHNCDSKNTWDFLSSSALDREGIIEKVEAISQGKVKRVSITGGDPLHPQFETGLKVLIQELKEKGYWINIEAAGTRVVPEVFDAIDFISFDVKTPSTGVRTPIRNILEVLKNYPHKLQIKSVIANKEDFDFIENLKEHLEQDLGPLSTPWVLTPCLMPGDKMKKSGAKKLMDMAFSSSQNFRVVAQQHKWVYGSKAQNV